MAQGVALFLERKKVVGNKKKKKKTEIRAWVLCNDCNDLRMGISDLDLNELQDYDVPGASSFCLSNIFFRVVVAPSSQGARILLAKAVNEAQVAAIGNSTGGRVGFFMYTTNFNETYEGYKSKGIEFIETPRRYRPCTSLRLV